jgi:hypothetical protein
MTERTSPKTPPLDRGDCPECGNPLKGEYQAGTCLYVWCPYCGFDDQPARRAASAQLAMAVISTLSTTNVDGTAFTAANAADGLFAVAAAINNLAAAVRESVGAGGAR